MNKIGVVDLFAGCGGLTDGFELHGGYKTVAAVEWERYPCETLINRMNKKWKYTEATNRVLQFDIQRTKELMHGWNDTVYGIHDGLLKTVDRYGNVDLVIGGPPCQAYSVAGRIRDKDGMQLDYRNYLFESYLKTVEALQMPRIIVFENVPGIISATPGGISIVERISKAFKKLGYIISNDIRNNAVFNMVDYGVPQNRKRVIIIGLNKNHFENNSAAVLSDIYEKLHQEKNNYKRINVKEALSSMDTFYSIEKKKSNTAKKFSHYPKNGKLLNSVPRFHNKRDISIFRMLAEDIKSGKKKYLKTDALKALYTSKTGKTSSVHKYYVLRNDEPSNTIPAHLYKDGLRHIHPDPKQARSLTVREAARLQGFDDDFEFLGPMGAQYKMIGNAVPPYFAMTIAKTLHKLF